MEKEKQLLHDIGEVDEKYIDEADTQIAVHPERRISWTKFAAAAACIAAVVIVMKNLPSRDNIDIPPAEQVTTITSAVTSGVSQVTTSVSETNTLSGTTAASVSETSAVSGTSVVSSVTENNAQQTSAAIVTEYIAVSSAEETAIIPGADPQVTVYVDNIPETSPVTTTEKPLSFESISNHFKYSSGASGWSDVFKLNGDGTFYGEFKDYNIGGQDENGEYYYNCNYCGYDGSFDSVSRISDTVYEAKVGKCVLNNERAPYDMGDRLILQDDPEIHEGDEIIFYLSGTKTSDMDEECLIILGMPKAWGGNPPEVLSENVIYNKTAKQAFFDDNGNVRF